MDFILSEQAKEELERRSIPLPVLDRVLQYPEQIVPEHGGRVAYQSRIQFDGGRTFLVRAIVAPDAHPPLIVTVYRTLRIEKILEVQLKVTYDSQVDVLRIILRETIIEESDEEKPGLILDYDADGNLVGLEVLDASKRIENPRSLEFAMMR